MQLFHESWIDALREVIAACGGARQVAGKLWPEKSPDAAQRLLLDCLNDNRPERLDPDRLCMVMRMGRDIGCHAGADWLLRHLGYEDSKVVQPQDQQAKLMQEFIDATKRLQYLSTQINVA